ncbi:hypothetical protein C8046_13605 [Serinibacter arcticus]|uniref:Uncharacterized protein n=1 Tax=Serinibacter arcticus TaxID=1655435 RepID=A0A2U1ZX21_9MICO|nr:hypothetical protein [Serinibacter arcticus]PWD51537.1 hypothetical protein C8046_13605 [Serinibacter arcticus]
MSEPRTAATTGPASAADALAKADALAAGMNKQVIGVQVAVGGFALASVAGLAIMGLAPAPGGIIGGTFFIVGAAIMLSVIGASAKARPAAFKRRYGLMIATWALVYVAVVALGMTVLLGNEAFWIVGAVASAIPGLWFLLQTRSAK